MAERTDEGFTLVETMVALVIVTVGVLALTAELTAYIHHQAVDKSRTAAVRTMTKAVERARSLRPQDVAILPATDTATTPDGRYTTTTTVQHCSLSDGPTQCTAPASASVEDVRVRVTVSWLDGTTRRSVSTATSLADDTSGRYSPTGTGTLSTLVGGAAGAASNASVSSFSATSTVTVDSAGVPTSAITLAMTTVGLTGAVTSIPVTWTDDNGSHQWSLTGGGSSWTATIPAASFKKVQASGTSLLTFAATVPGASAIPTASTTVRAGVAISSCTVSPNPVVLTVLTRKTALTETLSCTVSGLAATDTVTVSYVSGASSTTRSLTSANGTSWTYTMPVGTAMANGALLTEQFTFTATRASDGLAATSVVTAVLA